METSIKVPKELESLLSCGLCHRPYDLATSFLPRELICRHSFCDECVTRSTFLETSECICNLCGVRTHLFRQTLPKPTAIMYLLREMPALVLGRAMLDFSEKNNNHIIEDSKEEPKSPSENWLEDICMDSFLANSAEHCFIHAMPNSTWCHNCQLLLCRACSDVPQHHDHDLVRNLEYNVLLRQLLDLELEKIKQTANRTSELANREMNLLRELCATSFNVQLHVKRIILEHHPSLISSNMMGWHLRAKQDLSRVSGSLTVAHMHQMLIQLVKQRRKFEGLLTDVHFECRMRAAVQENGMQILDFKDLNDRIVRLRSNPYPGEIPANVEPPQALILTNFCVFVYWSEVQRRMLSPRSRTPTSSPDILPQPRRAVVPPHFNHCFREHEIQQYSQEVEHEQNQILRPPMRERSAGASSSPSSSSSSNSTNQSIFSSSINNATASSCDNTGVLDSELHRNVQLFRLLMWQDQQREMRLEQQRHMSQQVHHPSYPTVQPESSWVNNWEEQMQNPQQQQQQQYMNHQHQDYQDPGSSSSVSIMRQPSIHCYPIYFLDMEIAGELAGRVLIEVRSDAAPKMADNFGALVRHDRGYGYRGCVVFQAWGGESIITGDFELQNGRGGHSAFEDRYFLPDDTGWPAYRGTIGMRRGQRRQDKSGFVGSQFRLVLNEMRSFTAIFGFIVQGIDLVDRIASSGNALGRPELKCIIRNCGEYHLNQ
ncbi:LOW QUALITY PROTEIN: uncharacterized protein LOC108116603 [Drosophila eugracilis]|uniref:LOW QUALITY PROTEIN: uncharacterized protein LOC108116603 n=1 Tax=Drosophila eugracilis TaxID=29029 RepID=UPI0007E84835|nr:LOW QUALITY PROTEIN: uncharacterized protein LOC108116603 [Drosophila eugracilis]